MVYKLIGIGVLAIGTAVAGRADDAFPASRWNKELLNTQLHGVRINSNAMHEAWQDISTKYLLQANLFLDPPSDEDSVLFGFRKETATIKELLEAFLAAYPAYTYTQDPGTGVLWIHPKRIRYDAILNQRLRVDRNVCQVPVLSRIVLPLCRFASVLPVGNISKATQAFSYSADLPAGDYSARELLNLCCLANPTKAFKIVSQRGGEILVPFDLYYGNPLAPPRAAAVRFWEIEFGSSTNAGGIPAAEEVARMMSDANWRKRWAARTYVETAKQNYLKKVLVESGDPETAVWAALGYEAATFRGIGDPRFLLNIGNGFTNYLTQIRDPGLALLTLLELAREGQDSSYLRGIVNKHTFTPAEVASIKPDVYRMLHGSERVRDKLRTMNLKTPEFSPQILRELQETNLFALVPAEAN